MIRISEAGFPLFGETWTDADNSIEEVAFEFVLSLPTASPSQSPEDAEYCTWFRRMRRQAEELDRPPAAFSDWVSEWRCGETPIEPPPGWKR